jgi:hypothetical protein
MMPNDNFYYWVHRSASNGTFLYCGRPVEYWMKRAKLDKSDAHFIIASYLMAMEMWDIIGC